MNLKRINSAARAVRLPDTALSHIRNLSVSISCFSQYKKSICISEDLAFALGLMKTAAILPIQDEEVLMVAETLPYNNAIPVTLENCNGAKIITGYGVVDLLTEVFDLDFTHHYWIDFRNITLERLMRHTVALVRISD